MTTMGFLCILVAFFSLDADCCIHRNLQIPDQWYFCTLDSCSMVTQKLLIGIEIFEEICKTDFYYVDKTGLIVELIQN